VQDLGLQRQQVVDASWPVGHFVGEANYILFSI
jgi:hypothetical protein